MNNSIVNGSPNYGPSTNTELYCRSYIDSYEINTGTGLRIYEVLGEQNGNSDTLSVAIEEFDPKGKSPAHFHSRAEEYQYVMEGCGKLIVGNQIKMVSKGDFIKIPKGMNHQTFNESLNKTLKLCCFLTPSWTSEDTTFTNEAALDFNEKADDIYMRKKENCSEINAGKGEFIYEFLGKENGPADDISIALVEIQEGCSSEAHLHPEAEEYYIGIEGQGRLVIDGETRYLTPYAINKIPKGIVHQIFNDKKEDLKFLCVCAPAWTPECYVKV